jgi:hypothetical protein
MGWHLAAGIAQLVLTLYYLSTHWTGLREFFRTGRRTVNTFLYLVPMAILAVGTLVGAVWAVVVSAVFYSAWLLNHLLSWLLPNLPRRGGRPRPDGGYLILGLLLVVVVVLTWYAAVVAYR